MGWKRTKLTRVKQGLKRDSSAHKPDPLDDYEIDDPRMKGRVRFTFTTTERTYNQLEVLALLEETTKQYIIERALAHEIKRAFGQMTAASMAYLMGTPDLTDPVMTPEITTFRLRRCGNRDKDGWPCVRMHKHPGKCSYHEPPWTVEREQRIADGREEPAEPVEGHVSSSHLRERVKPRTPHEKNPLQLAAKDPRAQDLRPTYSPPNRCEERLVDGRQCVRKFGHGGNHKYPALSYGEMLSEQMARKGLGAEDLAQFLGVSIMDAILPMTNQTVLSHETNERIARWLGVKLFRLYGKDWQFAPPDATRPEKKQ